MRLSSPSERSVSSEATVAPTIDFSTPTPGPEPTATPQSLAEPDNELAVELTIQGKELFVQSDLIGAEAAYIDAIAAEPEYLPAYLGLTETYLYQPQYWQQALTTAESAVALAPKDSTALAYLAWAQQGAHHFTEAWETALQAVELGPDDPIAHTAASDILSSVYEQEASLEHAKRAIELDEDLAVAWATMGAIQSLLHEWSAAERSYAKAVDLEPDFFAWHLLVARHDLNIYGEVETARDLVARAIELQPAHPWVLSFLVDAATESNQWEEAEDACLEMLSFDQPHTPYPDAYTCLAVLYLQQENLTAAEFYQVFAEERATENRLDITLLRMRLHNDREECEEGRDLAQAWLDARPYSVVAKRMIGVSYLCAEEYEQAITYFQETVETLPKSVADARLLINAYGRAEMVSEATVLLNQIKIFASNDPFYYQTQYELNMILGRLDEALNSAQRWQVLRPESTEPRVRLALIQLFQGNLEAAYGAARKAIEEGDISSTAYAVLGETLSRQRQFEEAEKYLLLALERNAEHFLTRNYLAGLYLAQSRCEDALPHLNWLEEEADDDNEAQRYAEMMRLCEQRAESDLLPVPENGIDDATAEAEARAIVEEAGASPRMIQLTETESSQWSFIVAYSTELAASSEDFLELERTLALSLAQLLPQITSQPEVLLLVSGSDEELEAFTMVATRAAALWVEGELTDEEFAETWLRQSAEE